MPVLTRTRKQAMSALPTISRCGALVVLALCTALSASSLAAAASSPGAVTTWGPNGLVGPAGTNVIDGAPTELSDVIAVAGGLNHSYALRSTGAVVTWGHNGYDLSTRPMPPGLSGVTAIASGPQHGLALMADGTVRAWGRGDDGQTAVPAGMSNVKSIAAGTAHSLAITADGSVHAWGWNSAGQTNVPAEAMTDVIAIAGGYSHSLALKSSGRIVAWGCVNAERPGNLGECNVPAAIQGNVAAISAGNYFSIAVTRDGRLHGWGANGYGETAVPDLSDVVAVASQGWHSLALRSNGTVVQWGWNWNSPPQPAIPAGLSGVTAIGVGDTQNLAVRAFDTIPPHTSASLSGHAGASGWWVGPVTVTLSAADEPGGSGVAATTYSVDALAAQTYAGAFTVGADGRHAVAFHSTDHAGNVEPDNTTSFNIDQTPPSTASAVSGTSGTNGWYKQGSPLELALTASDNPGGSGVASTTYSVNGGVAQPYASPVSLAEGSSTVTFQSTDVAGNVEVSKSTSVKLDQTPASTIAQLTGPSGKNGWYTGAVSVTLVATDNLSGVASTTYSVDGGVLQVYGGPFTISTNREHTILFSSTDNAGNIEAVRSALVNIDSLPPLTVLAPAAPARELVSANATVKDANGTVLGPVSVRCWTASAPAVTLTALDRPNPGGSGVLGTTYSLNAGPEQSYSSPLKIARGVSTIRYRSMDNAGNIEADHTDRLMSDGSTLACLVNPAPALPLPAAGTLSVTGMLGGVVPFSAAIAF